MDPTSVYRFSYIANQISLWDQCHNMYTLITNIFQKKEVYRFKMAAKIMIFVSRDSAIPRKLKKKSLVNFRIKSVAQISKS